MDAPPIQYARTDDGVNIAYAVAGEGVPILRTPAFPFSNVAEEWDIDAYREWYEALGRLGKLVRYDARGQGLSDRDGVEYSRAASLRDMEAVAEQAGPGPFVVFGQNRYAVTAIDFSLAHPDNVLSLVLWCPVGLDPDHVDGMEPIFEGSKSHRTWTILVRSLTAPFFGWTNPEMVRQYTNMAEECVTRESFELQVSATLATRRSASRERLHEQVRHPTLVLFRRDSLSAAEARAAASEIAGSRLGALSGEANPVWAGDIEPVTAALESFLRDTLVPDDETRADSVSSSGAFRTILFTDLESSTALTQKLGDAKAQDVLHGHNDIVRAALAANDGEEVKHTGDGIMASFGSAVAAVEAALAIQRDLAAGEIRVRIGLNAGEPIAEDHDYFGTAVQLAARICDRAEPGQVLVSNVVRELCAGKTFAFEDVGAATLKGFPEPVRLFAVESPKGDA